MVSIQDDLLQQCTVRLTPNGGTVRGTGFFVDSNTIVTCAHVVEDYQTDSISVSWQGQSIGTAIVEAINSDADLALLQIDISTEHDYACVLLGEAFSIHDQCHTYGYSDTLPDGNPLPLTCSGEARRETQSLIKVHGGLIEPGYSGAPLLNEDNGWVCGVISQTFDSSTDLGGLAIPVKALFKCFPGIQVRNKAFHRTDKRWMHHIEFKTTKAFDFSVAKAKKAYYEQLKVRFGKVVFSGIAGSESERRKPINNVFVMPDVRRYERSSSVHKESPPTEIARNDEKLTQWERRVRLKNEEEHIFSLRPIPASRLLNAERNSKIVLLGAPGSGKTTFASYFVVSAASSQPKRKITTIKEDFINGIDEYFPILIHIRELARYPDLSVLNFLSLFVEKELNISRIPAGFFEHWIEANQAIIFLDGLDEVSDSLQRRKVLEKIETFLATCGDCPVVITSRPSGYRDEYFRREGYTHYELLPFDDNKINTFIEQWYDDDFGSVFEIEESKKKFRRALSDKPRIKRLARNPLLLTIIALIHRSRQLPKQRHELYQTAVDTLISSWDSNKAIKRSSMKYLDQPDIQRLMERLAHWAHTNGTPNDLENGMQIERTVLLKKLSSLIRELKCLLDLQPYQADQEAKMLLDDVIGNRAGLLSQQGLDQYSFVHKTFQEYLCSKEILYLEDNQAGLRSSPTAIHHVENTVREYLHYPHWREVILLLFAQQKPDPAKELLEYILNAKSEYERWLHRDLLLAGRCLSENSRINDREVVSEVLNGLIQLEIQSQPVMSEKLRHEVYQVITGLHDTPFASIMMDILYDHRQDIEKWRFIGFQSELDLDGAIAHLASFLSEDNDSYMRSRASAMLVQIGYRSENLIEEIFTLFEDEDWHVRSRAAESLIKLGQESDFVNEKLLSLLEDSDSDKSSRAAECLTRLNNTSDIVINHLVSLLKDESLSVRSRATSSLEMCEVISDNLKNRLYYLLSDEDSDACSRTAELLVKFGIESNLVVNKATLFI